MAGQLESNGDYTFTLKDQMDHADDVLNNDNQTLNIDLSTVIVATDEDGDSLTLSQGFTITVEDDIPVALYDDGEGPTVTGTVDEDELADGITDNDAETTVATGSVTSLFDIGADQPGSYSLASDFAGLEAQSLTSSGYALVYGVVGDTLTATANGSDVFTLVLAANGDYTFTLKDQMDHADDAANNDDQLLSINLSSVIVATDFDGDTATLDGGFTITVEDDIPVDITPEAGALLNAAGADFTGDLDLDGDISDKVGADQPGTLAFDPALDGFITNLESDDKIITYNVSGDILTASTDAGTVFTVTLDAASGDYTIDMVGTVDDGATTIIFGSGDFEFVGGNDPWAGFVPMGQKTDGGTPVDDDSKDLLITPIFNGVDDSTVNLNNSVGGIGTGQSMGPGEAIRLDSVLDLTGDPQHNGGDYSFAASRDHVFDGHWITNGVSAAFPNIAGGSKESEVRISVFDDDDTGPANVVGGGDLDSITSFVISYHGFTATIDKVDNAIHTVTLDGHDYEYTFEASGELLIDHVVAENNNPTTIAVFTDDGFNSVEYAYVSGETFKTGDFAAGATKLGEEIDLSFDLVLTDADGDTAAATIDISLAPEGSIVGDDGDNDPLNGTDSDEFIYGLAGDDVLIGGLGDDILTGGSGADTFDFNLVAEAATLNSTDGVALIAGDIITDLSSEDTIDIADMLADISGVATYDAVLDANDTSNAILQISEDGSVVAEITIENFAAGDGITSLADILGTVDDVV